MSRRTQDPLRSPQDFAYRTITFYGIASQLFRLSCGFVTPCLESYNPSPKTGLGYFRFARHYSGNRVFFIFLQLLRCFSSLGYLHCSYVFTTGYLRITIGEFPHSEIPGSKLTYSSPRQYRSLSRPSSASNAKASTIRP